MNSLPTKLSSAELHKLESDPVMRRELARQSFDWFFHFYYNHYVKYPTADFQREMMRDASNPEVEHLVILAFAGSGKSTIITTAYPLWSIISGQKNHVLIASQTIFQAQQHLKNIAIELESNVLLHNDFWPYDTEANEAGVTAIHLPKFKAKIVAISREQGIRGMRYRDYRPDVIIADDVEDSMSVRTEKGRTKTYKWFVGELMRLAGDSAKFITIGNLLHEDSLIMNLRSSILAGSRSGTYREYPVLKEGKTLWPGRFPDEASLVKLKRRMDDTVIWEREYMLRLIPDERQIITRDMIHTYPQLPAWVRGEYRYKAIGVDPAISEKDTADCTAMVTLYIRRIGDNVTFYVQPNPINGHPGFPETMDLIKDLNVMHKGPAFYVESVAYQTAIVQSARREVIDARPVNLQMDKRTRLNMISSHIRDGTILFPETGFEVGISQLTGFGVERYDDLVDALTIAVIGYLREQQDGKHDTIRVIGRVNLPKPKY